MTYKAFEDFYHEAYIRHLLLVEYNGQLYSPPFATELCREYSKVLKWDGKNLNYIDLNLPPVTSKTNATPVIGDSLWLIPYGIWDNFNTVVQIKNDIPIYHTVNKKGKGQFYSVASSVDAAFSFPLGYEDTSYGLYIKDNSVTTVDFNRNSHTKMHMGCVFSNGKFWSMPRGDTKGYVNLVSFNGNVLEEFAVPHIEKDVTRKYTDLIAIGDVLYALPFGETPGLNEIVEFDTSTKEFKFYPIGGPDFAKKYNVAVHVENKIIAVPYGDEFFYDSNLGIVFDTITKEIKQFDIGINYGGKYRYRCGVSFKGFAFFFPGGTPGCPIMKINQTGEIEKTLYLENILVGRPMLFQSSIYVITYNLVTKTQAILKFDENLNYETEVIF